MEKQHDLKKKKKKIQTFNRNKQKLLFQMIKSKEAFRN